MEWVDFCRACTAGTRYWWRRPLCNCIARLEIISVKEFKINGDSGSASWVLQSIYSCKSGWHMRVVYIHAEHTTTLSFAGKPVFSAHIPERLSTLVWQSIEILLNSPPVPKDDDTPILHFFFMVFQCDWSLSSEINGQAYQSIHFINHSRLWE